MSAFSLINKYGFNFPVVGLDFHSEQQRGGESLFPKGDICGRSDDLEHLVLLVLCVRQRSNYCLLFLKKIGLISWKSHN